jgi:hypothetical protein
MGFRNIFENIQISGEADWNTLYFEEHKWRNEKNERKEQGNERRHQIDDCPESHKPRIIVDEMELFDIDKAVFVVESFDLIQVFPNVGDFIWTRQERSFIGTTSRYYFLCIIQETGVGGVFGLDARNHSFRIGVLGF